MNSPVLPRERAVENLYEGIRDAALDDFAKHGIRWWNQ
jgi:hypothetical protein